MATTVNPGSPFPFFPGTGLVPIHSGGAVSSSGSVVVYPGANKTSLFVNVLSAPTGTLPTLSYTVQEVDPGDNTTPVGTPVTAGPINGVVNGRVELPMVFGGAVKVSWTVTGTLPNFPSVYATLVSVVGATALVDSSGADVAASVGGTTASAITVQGNASGTPVRVSGNRSNNNAAPGSTNTGSLTVVANAAAPSWTEGNLVTLSSDLNGWLRTTSLQAGIPTAAAPNTAVQVAGSDGTNLRVPFIDPNGRVLINGAGSAGSAVGGVLTVQGVASMTPIVVNGDRTNNSAAPNATNIGALTVRANAAAPSWTEGNLVTLSSDLNGNLRITGAVTGTKTNNNAAPGAINLGVLPAVANAVAPAWTEGNQVALSTDLAGSQRVTVPQYITGASSSLAFGASQRLSVSSDSMLFFDPIQNGGINTALWSTSATTMTSAVSNGMMTLNSGSVTAINTNIGISSLRQIPCGVGYATQIQHRAKLLYGTNPTNCQHELGVANGTGGAAITDGIIFRLDSNNQFRGVVSQGGSETTTSVLTTPVSNAFYTFQITIYEDRATFAVINSDGTIYVQATINTPLANQWLTNQSYLPVFARVLIGGTVAPSAPQIGLVYVSASQKDVQATDPYAVQLCVAGARNGNIDPTTYAQTANCSLTANPTTVTLSTTGIPAGGTGLGGCFAFTSIATTANMQVFMGRQNPSPYTLVITGFAMPPPVVTTIMGATISIFEFSLVVANTSNPSTATQMFCYPLGMFSATASAAVGTVFNGQSIIKQFTSPVVVPGGWYVYLMVRPVSAPASGVVRGTIDIQAHNR